MAKDVKPTRKNLMDIEDRIELSERGHGTLELGWDLLPMLPREALNRIDEDLIEEHYREETVDAVQAD